MDGRLRKSGISIIGNTPWRTHFCLFYQTKQDLLDIIIPYIKSGLENNELCIWVVPESLIIEEVREALKMAIPGFDIYLEKEQIEIVPYNAWYLKEGIFDSQKTLEGLADRLNQILSNGYEGLRLTQDAFWQKDDLDDFINYERKLNSLIGEYSVVTLCTYAVDKFSPIDTIEIAANHDFSLSKKKDKWKQIKNKRDKNISTAINSINQIIHSTLNFDEIMKRTVSEASRIIGSDTAAISLRKGNRWIVSYVHGFPEGVIGAEMNDEEEPHAVLAIKTKKPVAINNAFNDERVNRDHMKKWGIRSVLVVPLTTKDEIFGVIFFNFQKSIFVFNNSHIDFAVQLAASVSLALENLRLFENLEMELIKREQAEKSLQGAYEEIQAQSEELQAVNEELQAQSEELQSQSEELQAQNEELQESYQTLRESEKRLSIAKEAADLGIHDYNVVSGVIQWDNRARELWGVGQDELITYDTFIAGLHPEDRATTQEKVNKALDPAGDGKYYAEYRVINRTDGIERWVAATGNVFFEQGCAVQLVGTVGDITERKQAEKALFESEKKYRQIVETAQEGIWLIDGNDRTIFVNQKVADMLGCSIEEILGKSPQKFMSQEFREKADSYLREHTKGINHVTDYRFIKKDGSDLWCILSSRALFDNKGEYAGSLAMITDITERKAVEEAMRESEEKYTTIFDKSPSAIALTKMPEGILIGANETFLRMFEYTWDEVVGTTSIDLGISDTVSRAQVAAELEALGSVQNFECTRTTKSGIQLVLSLNLNWVSIVGQKYILTTIQDITAVKRAEEALKEVNEKLEEKIKERTAELENAYNSLKESEEELANAQKMAYIGNWNWDLITGKVQCSDEQYRIFGLPPQIFEITYNIFLNYVHPEDRAYVENAIKRALSGRLLDIDFRIIRENGEERIVHELGEVTFNELNTPVRMRGTVQDITERKQMEAMLESIARLPQENPNSVMRLSKDFVINYANPAAQVLLTDWGSAIGKEAPTTITELADSALGDGVRRKAELKYADHIYLINLVPFPQAGYVNLYASDITELKVAEETLVKMDKSRIKEIHHRIKNNLQVISSLIDLQAETFSNLETCKVSKVMEAFKENQNRVISMALIHEELYEGNESGNLAFAAYLRKLTTYLLNSYSLRAAGVRLKLDFEEVYLDMDIAIPLGIIVNELVSNSLKHAFPSGKEPEISVILQRTDDFTTNRKSIESDNKCKGNNYCFVLIVADNGRGFPEGIDLQTINSLGLQLVNILVDQLDGCIELKRDSGTKFYIWFNNIEN